MRAVPVLLLTLVLLAGCGSSDSGSGSGSTSSTASSDPATSTPKTTRPIVGMGDQGPGFMTAPLYTQLGLKHVRLIASYDTVDVSFDRQLADAWLAAAKQTGSEPLVAFGHSRRKGRALYLPSVAEYTKAFKAFHARYPQVKLFTAWNEPNNQSQPTDKRPERAAQYANALKEACPSCELIAGDVLDEPDAPAWTRRYVKALTARPTAWSLHDYSATNRFAPARLDAVLDVLPGRVWITETGGVARFGKDFPFDLARQAKATTYTLKLARERDRVDRVYLYNWTGAAPDARFDAGLTNPDGSPRPAYTALKAALDESGK